MAIDVTVLQAQTIQNLETALESELSSDTALTGFTVTISRAEGSWVATIFRVAP